MSVTESGCRTARQQMVEALLASPPRVQLSPTLADHVVACHDCAQNWRSMMATARLFTRASSYGPRLRARTCSAAAATSCAWIPPSSFTTRETSVFTSGSAASR